MHYAQTEVYAEDPKEQVLHLERKEDDSAGEESASAADRILRMETQNLSMYYQEVRGVDRVDMPVYADRVTALIGPSGCGKTTFLRSLNRMHDLTKGARVTGKALLDGKDIYAPGQDPILVRRKIGMVFQKPNPFPTMSIYDNVSSGLRLAGIRKRSILDEAVEYSLTHAALWNEVKDRLKSHAFSLSGGQQQRLCIARALAVEPEVILMDEPTSSLDPKGTASIEELITMLKEEVTIIMVTHNMHQAMRISDYTAFFYLGSLIEFGRTKQIFTHPREEKTEEYVGGQFG